MFKPHFQYSEGTNTLRQQPQNYMLAYWDENRKVWLMDPDAAAAPKLVVALTLSLMVDGNRFRPTPEKIFDTANEHLKFWE